MQSANAEFEGRDGGNDDDVDDEFDDDAETVKGMARLFCEVAEAYICLLLAPAPQVRQDKDHIVCVSGFRYRLQAASRLVEAISDYSHYAARLHTSASSCVSQCLKKLHRCHLLLMLIILNRCCCSAAA